MRVVNLTLCRFLRVHLFNLLDGLPHEVPLRKVLPLDWDHHGGCFVTAQRINGSRIALVVEFVGDAEVEDRKELVAWDWRTGELVSTPSLWGSGSDPILNQVLECSSDDPVIGTAISAISDVHLLEGSWLVALSDRNTSPQLIVFNTLLPQQDAKSWRILQLPRLPCGDYFFSSRYGDWPAEFPGFLVDPAQMSFVMSSQKSALVIPVEPFIREISSARANPFVQWDDWGKHVVRTHLHPKTLILQLVGTKLLALRSYLPLQGTFFVDTYDLSKSGQGDIQQVNEWQDGGFRKVLLTPKCSVQCQVEGFPNTLQFVGNKLVCFYVSLPTFKSPRFIFTLLRIDAVAACW